MLTHYLKLLFIVFLFSACEFDPNDYPQLKIKEIKIGKGDPARGWDTVFVHYKGWYLDGVLFDQTQEGEPRRFSMGSKTLIKGWRIGILGMKPGGIRKLTIPPDLAFGKKGKLGSIRKNATLIFEIELVSTQ